MQKWAYEYVDGTLHGIEQGTVGVNIGDNGDYIRIWKGDFSVDIPKRHIVEVQHFKVEAGEKSNKGLITGTILGVVVAGLMFTPLAPVIMGAKLVAIGASPLAFAVLSIPTGIAVGKAQDVLIGLGTRVKQENAFMISYLEENDPTNLKVIVFEHGKMFLKDAVENFNILVNQHQTTPKSDFVTAFVNRPVRQLANASTII